MKIYKILALVLLSFSINIKAQDTAPISNHDEGLQMYASFAGGYLIAGNSDYDFFIGGYTHFDFNFDKHWAYRLDIGWNDMTGDEIEYMGTDGKYHTNTPSMSMWEFTTGVRYRLSIFYIEGRAGYFTGIHSWGLVPALGIKYRQFDLQANIILTKQTQWGGARIAYFF